MAVRGGCSKVKAVVIFQFLSHVQVFAAPWTAAHQTSLSFNIFWSLLKLKSVRSVILSNDLVLCHPLLLLPSIFPSMREFSNESVLHIRWPKDWSFSFSISSSSEYPGLIFWSVLNTVAWIWANQAIISHGIKQDLIIKMALGSTDCPPSCLGKFQTSSSYMGLTAVLSWVGSQWGTQSC